MIYVNYIFQGRLTVAEYREILKLPILEQSIELLKNSLFFTLSDGNSELDFLTRLNKEVNQVSEYDEHMSKFLQTT